MRRSHNILRASLVCTVLGLSGVAILPLRAADAPAEEPDHKLGHKQLSPEELLRLRILEAKSGARDNIGKTPQSQTLSGPQLSDHEKLLQAMNRLSYGPRPGDIQKAIEMGGWEAWAKQQLNPDSIDDSELEKELPQRYPFLTMNLMAVKEKYSDDKENRYILPKAFPNSVLYRAVNSKRQFKELMVDFWRNHFCIDQPHSNEKSRMWTSPDYEEQVIRKNVFGKFKTMLYASATHPAMLEYLDQQLSRAGEWNENYAREVMELHTLGADKGYTDKDVAELSKALTGWRYNKQYKFEFDQAWHQKGPKNWCGITLPEGQRGGEQALIMLATHKNTAQFISMKLCRFLINDNPPPALVAKVAQIFLKEDGDLPKMYAAIVFSPEFMNRDNYRSKFKTPLQFAASTIRATNAKIENGDKTLDVLTKMGEPIYECADPTGYFDQAERWMDAGVLTKRWDFAWNLVRGGISGVSVPENYLERYKSMKPEEVEAKMIEDFIGGDVGDQELKVLQEAAATSDTERMLSIILGSPSFQQK